MLDDDLDALLDSAADDLLDDAGLDEVLDASISNDSGAAASNLTLAEAEKRKRVVYRSDNWRDVLEAFLPIQERISWSTTIQSDILKMGGKGQSLGGRASRALAASSLPPSKKISAKMEDDEETEQARSDALLRRILRKTIVKIDKQLKFKPATSDAQLDALCADEAVLSSFRAKITDAISKRCKAEGPDSVFRKDVLDDPKRFPRLAELF